MPGRSDTYVLRETLISLAINAVISAGFAWSMFGGMERVPVSGAGGLAFDFVPQTFMIALMGSLVPSAIARKRLRANRVTRAHGARHWFPGNLALRALAIAALTTLALAPAAAFLLAQAAGTSLDGGTVMPMKVAYGALIASLVTPVALTAELRMHGETW